MAKQNDKPLIQLTPQMKKELEESGVAIKEAHKAIAALKSLGVDASDLEDKITWAETTRDTLLKEFS